MTVARKLLLIVVATAAALAAAVYWAIGSEAGTRFLLARAPLPAALELEGVHGSLLYGIEARSIAWRSSDISVVISDIRVEVAVRRLLAREVWIRSLTVGGMDLRMQASGERQPSSQGTVFESPVDVILASAMLRELHLQFDDVVRDVDEVELAGTLRGSRLSDLALAVRSSWLDADLLGSGGLTSDFPVDLDLGWTWKEGPVEAPSGRLEVRGNRERYSVQHRLIEPLELLTSGYVSYMDGVIGIDVDNSWQSIEWPLGDSVMKSADGSLRLVGTPDELSFELSAAATLDSHPSTEINATGLLDANGARFSRLILANRFGELLASGSTTWSPTPGFDVDFEFSSVDSAAAHTTLGGDVSGAGTVSYDGEQLQLERGLVRVGNNSLRIEGVANETVALVANADFPDISALIPGVSGALSVAADVRGRREDPEIQVTSSGTDLQWSGLSAERLDIDVNGTLDSHSIRAELAATRGKAELAARGGLQQREWSGEVTRFAVSERLAGDWGLRKASRLAISPERMTLTELCLQRTALEGQACASVDAAFGQDVDFDVAITQLPVAAIPVSLPDGVSVAGFADASAAGSYANRRLSAELAISLLEARVDAVVDDEPVAAVLRQAEGRATITSNALRGEVNLDLDDDLGMSRLELAVADILDTGSVIGGEGVVAIDDLALLGLFMPDIANPRGAVRGRVAIGGTLAEPEFTGDLAVVDAAFEVRRAGIEIREVNIQLAQASPGRLRFDGRAVSGDGHLSVSGDTWVSSGTGIRSEIRLDGQDFELLRLPDWRVTASPDIVAIFDDRVTRISGELVVPSADIRARDVPQTAVSSSPDVVVHRADMAEAVTRRRVEVDIRAALGDSVRFEAFGLTTGITGAVQLRGGTHQPYSGSGRLTLVGGRYKAYGQDLDIERGELIFSGPLDNPQLDVRAIRRTTDVTAGIQLSGTPSQLRSDVFSEPTLSEAEALSYLLTGRPLASASTTGDGDMLNAAAFALGVSSAGSIVSEIRAGLGLETLAIEGGSEDGRLIAGKRFGDRLLVEYGYGLVDNLGTLLLRYRLNDRITLESRTGTVSNFDIVYSVKKK